MGAWPPANPPKCSGHACNGFVVAVLLRGSLCSGVWEVRLHFPGQASKLLVRFELSKLWTIGQRVWTGALVPGVAFSLTARVNLLGFEAASAQFCTKLLLQVRHSPPAICWYKACWTLPADGLYKGFTRMGRPWSTHTLTLQGGEPVLTFPGADCNHQKCPNNASNNSEFLLIMHHYPVLPAFCKMQSIDGQPSTGKRHADFWALLPCLAYK